MRHARAVAIASAVLLAVCFAVVCACGRSHPNWACAGACTGLPVLVVLLAALRRVFGSVPSQAADRRVGGLVARLMHPDGHLDGRSVPQCQPAGRRARS